MNSLSIGVFRGFKSILTFSGSQRTYSTFNWTVPKSLIPPKSGFLFPSSVYLQQSAGMKDVDLPRRRCRHCYIVIQDERKYVFCDKFPRHKQVSRLPKSLKKNQMTMTHATQGGFNHGNGRGRMSMWCQQRLRMDF